MSDPLSVALDGLRGQNPPGEFAPPDAVRQRGRQRAARQAALAAVAVLTVVGTTAGLLGGYGRANGPDPAIPPPAATSVATPSPAPSGSASRSASVSPSAGPSSTGATSTGSPFLQAAELGPGQWQRTGHELLEGGRWSWAQLCPTYREADYRSLREQRSIDALRYADGPSRSVGQIIETYNAGKGAANVADVRSVLQRCSRTTKWPDGTAPAVYQTTPLDAGDEAFLVRTEARVYGEGEELAPEPVVSLDVVVRVGDRVTKVSVPGEDAAFARTLAHKAAARLG
jgi:hypothetical protein